MTRLRPNRCQPGGKFQFALSRDLLCDEEVFEKDLNAQRFQFALSRDLLCDAELVATYDGWKVSIRSVARPAL